jgi:hypothetical protein
MRLSAVTSCLILGALCALPGCAGDSGASGSQASSPAESASGQSLPLDLDGHPFDLGKKQPSPITVVIFTRTDCPVSNRYAPEVRHLYETYHPRGVEFFLVYVDPDEDSAAIRQHLREYSYPCKALRDPDHALVARCHATITPEAVVFDGRQNVAYLGRINNLYEDLGKPRAAATTHELADAIDATLAGKPVATPRSKAVGCTIADLKH